MNYFQITSNYYQSSITSYYYHRHYYILRFASVFSHECNITTYYYNTPLLHSMNYYVLLPLLPLLRITFRGNLQMAADASVAATAANGRRRLHGRPGPPSGHARRRKPTRNATPGLP
jgi:hypothetical protein